MNSHFNDLQILATPEPTADGIFVITNMKIKLSEANQRHGHNSQCFKANSQIQIRTFNLLYTCLEDNATYLQTITIALIGTDANFIYNISLLHNHLVLMYSLHENINSQQKIDLLDKNIYTLTYAEIIDENENKIVIF